MPSRPSFRPSLLRLEDRDTPADLYIGSSFQIDNDVGPAGLSTGDTVSLTTSFFPIFGLTFGTNAFNSFAAAVAAAEANDVINFVDSTTVVDTGVVIDKPLTLSASGPGTPATLLPAADAATWIRVTAASQLQVFGLSFDGQSGTRSIGEVIRFDSGSPGGSVTQAQFQNVTGTAVTSAADTLTVAATFANVGGGVAFSGTGHLTLRNSTYTGRGTGGSGETAVVIDAGAGATVTLGGNRITSASEGAVAVTVAAGAAVTLVGNELTGNGTAITVRGDPSGAVAAEYNTISGNAVGVSGAGPQVNAANNWWGGPTGPVAPHNTAAGTGVSTSPPLDGGPPPVQFGNSIGDYLLSILTNFPGNPPGGSIPPTMTGGLTPPGASGAIPLAETFTDGRVSPLVFGAGPGAAPTVAYRTADGATGTFQAYDAGFTGGVQVAVHRSPARKVTVATAPGAGGGPNVKLYSLTGLELASFDAYDPSFRGGVTVALADMNRDGIPDVITGAGEGGGPHVKVFDGRTLELLASFYAFDPAFHGGVRVAALGGFGVPPSIVVAAGPGGGPNVRVFALDGRLELSMYAYEESFTGGVYVAAGDVDADGNLDIVTGAGAGGAPRVRVFALTSQFPLALFGPTTLSATPTQDFYAFDPATRTGVTVAVAESGNATRTANVVTAYGAPSNPLQVPGALVLGGGPTGGPRVRVISQVTGLDTFDGYVFDPTLPGGVALGGLGTSSSS